MATTSCTKCDWEYTGKAVFGPRVLGAHMRRVHGINGKRRKLREIEAAVEEPKTYRCKYCDHAPYNSYSGMRNHVTRHHPDKLNKKKRTDWESMKQKRQSSSSKSVSSLDEAIMVLQLEVDARLEVIARLKSMTEGK